MEGNDDDDWRLRMETKTLPEVGLSKTATATRASNSLNVRPCYASSFLARPIACDLLQYGSHSYLSIARK